MPCRAQNALVSLALKRRAGIDQREIDVEEDARASRRCGQAVDAPSRDRTGPAIDDRRAIRVEHPPRRRMHLVERHGVAAAPAGARS